MSRLISRQKQIPGGFVFFIPALNWRSTPWASFDSIVDSALTALKANPHVAQNLGWDLSRDSMANRVDETNALLCEKMGWSDYITGGSAGGAASVPFPPTSPTLLGHLGRVAAGGKHVVEWLASGAEAVPKEQSESRAAVCTGGCPNNGKGDLLSYFTLPVTEAIRAALNQRREWKLETSNDHLLGVCEACDCPMKLKVHMPIEKIVAGLKDDQKAALWEKCWIRAEAKL